MPLQLDDLAALDAPTLASSGLPLMLAIESIDEDPEQPRQEFDEPALQDLAETIRARGVRQPVSVRPNLQQAGRWVLNFGARRLRASKLAGLVEIPAFIDTTADSYDQVIENEQREGLRPLELALFVQKRLALGDNQAEIARRLGKSRQWVTLATALIEAPDWLMQAYRDGRCRGMNELYDMRRLHGEYGEFVETWAAGQVAITRDRIAALRVELVARKRHSPGPAAATVLIDAEADLPTRVAGLAGLSGGRAVPTAESASPQRSAACRESPVGQTQHTEQRVHVEFEGLDYQLLFSVAPEQAGCMYVRPLTGGPRRLAPVGSLKLLGFVGA